MVVVDAQIHPWSTGESTGHHRRTPIDNHVLQREMREAGVDKVVLVPPLWDPEGNAYALSMAKSAPTMFSVMGVLDPCLPDAQEKLRTWHNEPCMRGVRFLLNTPERLQPLLDGTCDALWPIAEDLGIPVAILAPGQLAAVGNIAQQHPRLQIILDHLGVPRAAVGPSALQHWPQLLELATLPNLSVKAVGVGDYAMDPFPFRSLTEPLQQVFHAFGADRMIWGSDLSRLHHPYRHCVEHFQKHLPFLSSSDRAKVMGENILRVLNWN